MSAFQELVIKLKADSKGVMGELNKVTQKTSQMGQGFKGALNNVANSLGGWPVLIGGATAALGAATAGATAFGVASVKAYTESAEVVHKMESILKSTGRFSDELSKKLQNNADRLQGMTLFGDEDILQATSRIANLTKLTGPDLLKAQQGVVQLATKLQVDLPTAATIMSKAIAGNMGALSRYGLKLEDTGTAAGNLASVMTATSSGWDQARAAVDTFSGRLSQFRKYWGEILEKVGAVIAVFASYLLKNNEVKAAVEALGNSTKNVSKWMDEHKDTLNKVAESLADVLISSGSLITSITNLAGAFLGAATNTGKAQTSGDKFADALDAVKKAANGIKGIIDAITWSVNALAGAFNAASNAANGLTGAYERQKAAGRGLNPSGIAGSFTKAFTQTPQQRKQQDENYLRKNGLGWMQRVSYGGGGEFDFGVGDVPMEYLLAAYNGGQNGFGAMGGLMSGALMQSINQTIPQFSRLQQAGVYQEALKTIAELEKKTVSLTKAEQSRLEVLKSFTQPAIDTFDDFRTLKALMDEGKITTAFYTKELEKLKDAVGAGDGLSKTRSDVDVLNKLFAAGALNVNEYTKAYRELLKLNQNFNPSLDQMRFGSVSSVLQSNSVVNAGSVFGGLMSSSKNPAIQQFQELKTTGLETMSTLEQAARGFGDNFINIFEQAVLTGKLNFKDLAKSILADLAKIILQMTVIRPLSNAFSGFLGGLFGRSSGLSAGITSGFRAAFGGFRASGGPVMPNTAYMVGERGPELFMPKNAGSIVPNNRLQGNSQGGVTVIMNNNFALGLSENIRAQIAAETPKIVKAATAGVSAEIARGGPLARQVGARK